jgi:hypothetical protein
LTAASTPPGDAAPATAPPALFLELAEAHRFDTGAVLHVYRPRRSA